MKKLPLIFLLVVMLVLGACVDGSGKLPDITTAPTPSFVFELEETPPALYTIEVETPIAVLAPTAHPTN